MALVLPESSKSMARGIRVLPARIRRPVSPTESSASSGSMLLSRIRSARPIEASRMPKRSFTCWFRRSASTRITDFPLWARDRARLKDTVVLPSPGRVLVTRIMRSSSRSSSRRSRTRSELNGSASWVRMVPLSMDTPSAPDLRRLCRCTSGICPRQWRLISFCRSLGDRTVTRPMDRIRITRQPRTAPRSPPFTAVPRPGGALEGAVGRMGSLIMERRVLPTTKDATCG